MSVKANLLQHLIPSLNIGSVFSGVLFQADGQLVEGGAGVRLAKQIADAAHRPQPDSEAGIIETSEM
jgi:hypothetical protein